MDDKEILAARRAKHKANVSAAFAFARSGGGPINLSALMCGAEQTGADAFGGEFTIDNDQPLRSDDWKVTP